jgi:hypothetical protein
MKRAVCKHTALSGGSDFRSEPNRAVGLVFNQPGFRHLQQSIEKSPISPSGATDIARQNPTELVGVGRFGGVGTSMVARCWRKCHLLQPSDDLLIGYFGNS